MPGHRARPCRRKTPAACFTAHLSASRARKSHSFRSSRMTREVCPEITGANLSRWKKSVASRPEHWVRRNCCQDVSVRRGAGPIPPLRRIRRIVPVPTRWPTRAGGRVPAAPPHHRLRRLTGTRPDPPASRTGNPQSPRTHHAPRHTCVGGRGSAEKYAIAIAGCRSGTAQSECAASFTPSTSGHRCSDRSRRPAPSEA
jgi:hypothetical protein